MDYDRFNKVRIPRENLLNSVADVTPEGQYVSSIEDPDQVRRGRLLIMVPLAPKIDHCFIE